MPAPEPFCREAGAGAGVVCIHPNASSSGPCRELVERLARITTSIVNVRRWACALMTAPTPLAAFRGLGVPVLCLLGRQSTVAAKGVARRLTQALPRLEVLEFDTLGHRGPVRHPGPVNHATVRFLERV